MEQEDLEFLEYRRQLAYYLNVKKFTDPTDFISMSRVCDILRILHYKVLKFACPTLLTKEDLHFIELIELLLPQAKIEVSTERIRHKICKCVSAKERQENMDKAHHLAALLTNQPSDAELESEIQATMPDSEPEPDCYDVDGSPVYLDDLDEDGNILDNTPEYEAEQGARVLIEEKPCVGKPAILTSCPERTYQVGEPRIEVRAIPTSHSEKGASNTLVQAANGSWQMLPPIVTRMPAQSGHCEPKWAPSPIKSTEQDDDSDFVGELPTLLKQALVRRDNVNKLRGRIKYVKNQSKFTIHTPYGTLRSDIFKTPSVYHLGVILVEKSLVFHPGEIQYISALYMKHCGIWKPNISRPPDTLATQVLRTIPVDVAAITRLIV